MAAFVHQQVDHCDRVPLYLTVEERRAPGEEGRSAIETLVDLSVTAPEDH